MIAKLIALVLPLGLDTFAVCCALGMAGIAPAQRSRVTGLMVLFETGMPLIGVGIGAPLGHLIGSAANIIAIITLAGFGLYTLLLDDDDEQRPPVDRVRQLSWRAVALGVSISLDELAIGFTLGLLGLPVLITIASIGVQSLIVTQLGLRLGARLGDRVRERAEQLAGLALLALAVVLLTERLTGQ